MKLALDISTSITGLCILDDTKNIILLEPLIFNNKKKFPTFFSKAEHVESVLNFIKTKHNIDKIVIEAALLGFRPGMSSAHTISTLMKFNGIISWICYKEFGFEPEYLSATSARKKCGILVPKGQKAKKVVMDYLIKNDKQFLPYVKYTRNNTVKPECFDIADAYVLALAS